MKGWVRIEFKVARIFINIIVSEDPRRGAGGIRVRFDQAVRHGPEDLYYRWPSMEMLKRLGRVKKVKIERVVGDVVDQELLCSWVIVDDDGRRLWRRL